MRVLSTGLLSLALAGSFTLACASAQAESAREVAKTKAASIPDKVQTVAGELTFFDGVLAMPPNAL